MISEADAIRVNPLRRSSFFDVRTQLLDFAIVTFAIEPAKLQALLAPGFEAEVFTFADGAQHSFVSAVPFRDADFTMRLAPWIVPQRVVYDDTRRVADLSYLRLLRFDGADCR